jgi:hypothetical protein
MLSDLYVDINVSTYIPGIGKGPVTKHGVSESHYRNLIKLGYPVIVTESNSKFVKAISYKEVEEILEEEVKIEKMEEKAIEESKVEEEPKEEVELVTPLSEDELAELEEVTNARIKEILDSHNIHYAYNATKPELKELATGVK